MEHARPRLEVVSPCRRARDDPQLPHLTGEVAEGQADARSIWKSISSPIFSGIMCPYEVFPVLATSLIYSLRAELALIRQASPSAQTAYRLTQAFMHMVRERTGMLLDTWLQEAEENHLPEFESFATGIQQDKAAVLAGLTLPWSNGPTEGHVNRLKLIKRSMYGRAKFPLLRARVLQAA